MNVASICTRLPETIAPDATVLSASQSMEAQDVGTLVVTDRDGRPEGIITDRDIVIRCVAQELDPSRARVREVMSSDVHAVHEHIAVEVALEMMADREVRRLVVLNDAGRVTGIVSLDDFLEGVAAASEDIGRLLRRQVHI